MLRQNQSSNTTGTGKGNKINPAVNYHFQMLNIPGKIQPWDNISQVCPSIIYLGLNLE